MNEDLKGIQTNIAGIFVSMVWYYKNKGNGSFEVLSQNCELFTPGGNVCFKKYGEIYGTVDGDSQIQKLVCKYSERLDAFRRIWFE